MTKKRALAAQQEAYRSLRISRAGRSFIILLATLLSFSAFGLLAADQLFRPNTFVVDQLKIKGRFINLQPQQIEAVVKDKLDANFFALELDAIKASIEAIDWVQQVDVRREWPNGLLINVTEHTPVMHWNQGQWLNLQGEVINLPNVKLDNPVRLFGNDKEAKRILKHAYQWKQALQKEGLKLVSLSLSDSYAWRMTLQDSKNQFELMLGSHEVAERFARFKTIYRKQFKESDMQLQRIDARYPDGLAIKATQPVADIASLNEI